MGTETTTQIETVQASYRQKRWGYQISTTPTRAGFNVEPCDLTIPKENCRMTLTEVVRELRRDLKNISPAWSAKAIYLDGRRLYDYTDAVEVIDELEVLRSERDSTSCPYHRNHNREAIDVLTSHLHWKVLVG